METSAELVVRVNLSTENAVIKSAFLYTSIQILNLWKLIE